MSLFPPEHDVIGVDLSLTHTGMCLADGLVGHILTDPSKDRYGIEARCLSIRDRILPRCADAELVAVEAPAFAARGNTTDLGMVHGCVRSALYEAHIPFILIAPSSLKKYATGSGRATKPDMRAELLKRTGIDIRDDNECDAWWLRAMVLDALGSPIIPMPAVNRETLRNLLPVRA